MKENKCDHRCSYCKEKNYTYCLCPDGPDTCPNCTPTEPVTEDLREIIYRNYKNGDEIGLYTELKAFIRQTRLDLLNEIENEIEINKRGYETKPADARHKNRRDVRITKAKVFNFNAGLQVGVDIINKHKK